MKLFHGSEYIIEFPTYGKGAKINDYGRGFYCTEEIELAKEWACGKGNSGYANKYELDTKNLVFLNLNSTEYNILNWLALLAENRTYWQKSSVAEQAKKYLHDNFLPDISGKDVIVGYRADDSYFSFAQDFVANAISLRQLSEAMHLGRLGEQVVLMTKKAFSQITFLGYEEADAKEYFVKKEARDKTARQAYRNQTKKMSDIEDIYMLDIMREGIRNGDIRLR